MIVLSLQMKKQHRNVELRSLWSFNSAIDEFAGKTFRVWAGKNLRKLIFLGAEVVAVQAGRASVGVQAAQFDDVIGARQETGWEVEREQAAARCTQAISRQDGLAFGRKASATYSSSPSPRQSCSACPR